MRQTGGRGQYGVVELEVEPLERGAGFVFENKTVGGSVPREYVGPTEAGVKDALESGPVGGYPVVDVKVVAGRRLVPPGRLVGDGVPHGRHRGHAQGDGPAPTPVLLEPIMKVEVRTPEQFFGDVLGDINSRRGHVQDVETLRHAADHPGADAAGGDVRLHDGPAVADPGPRDPHHGVRPLRDVPAAAWRRSSARAPKVRR